MTIQAVLPFLMLFPAVILHELAHGFAALWLGDPTARDAGRLSLNPLRHIDPIGTVLLPAILVLSGSPAVFGWAKPVPVNLGRMRDPQFGMWFTAIAGPLCNLVQAALAIGVFRVLLRFGYLPEILAMGLFYLAAVNLALLVFNLLPIPPLDGSKVLAAVMPHTLARAYLGIQVFGFIIIFLLLRAGFLDRLFTPAFSLLLKLMGLR